MSTKTKPDFLGRGIRSLLQNIDSELQTTEGKLKEEVVDLVTNSTNVPLELIVINPKQPRRDFEESSLNELVQSIRIHGIIQPLTVSKLQDGKFQLIAGERRFRAAKAAGLKEVPVYLRQANDNDLLELALLENLQRENLNAVEIGMSYRRMMDELNYTQEQVAERMGKERSTVTNYIRLLKLPPDILLAVRNNIISMGHARAIISVDSVEKQLFIFSEIKKKGLSVRQTEELVRSFFTPSENTSKSVNKSEIPPAFKKIEENIASHFSTKVKMSVKKNGSGSITLEYYSLEELNNILSQMNIVVS